MRTTKVTGQAQDLIASQTLKSGFDIMAKRADRRVKALSGEVYDRLRKKQEVRDDNIDISYRFESYDKARTLTEGINEFCHRHPSYGKKLKSIIKQTRKSKRRYLNFGGELEDSHYMQVLSEIGIPEHMRESMLENIVEISDLFSKKKEDGLVELLVK